MSLQLHRPDERGDLVPTGVEPPDWRQQLRSRRWGASLKGGRLPSLPNPEMNPTSTIVALGMWIGLAAATFVLLVLGYGTGFWH